jgi:putative addiction module killer protein
VSLIRITEYLDAYGRSPFARWFAAQEAHAAAKIVVALHRMASGNLSNCKSVGGGVQERPGYRIYFGRDGEELVILLGGSEKRDQRQAIQAARLLWTEYRRRKQHGA